MGYRAGFRGKTRLGLNRSRGRGRIDNEREVDDYDSPWKGLLEQYVPDFLAWFFSLRLTRELTGRAGMNFWIRNWTR